MKLNKATAENLFHRVNVTGRFQDRWVSPRAWMSAASAQAQRIEVYRDELQRDGGRPLRRRLGHASASARMSFDIGTAWSLRAGRFLLPIYADAPLDLAMNLAPPAGLFEAYPAFELLFGRGHDVGMTLRAGASTYERGVEQATHWGAAGLVLEKTPQYLAQRAERSGYDKLATACHLGAACGRLALQPVRVVVSVWALANACVWGAGYALLFGTFLTVRAFFEKPAPRGYAAAGPAGAAPPAWLAEARPHLPETSIDVHADGRPRRVQKAISELRAHHQTSDAVARAQLRATTYELGAFLRTVEREGLLVGRAPCGLVWAEAARRALHGGAGSLLDLQNPLLLPDEDDAVTPVAHVVAMFWSLIANGPLNDAGNAEQEAALRRALKLAFVKALATCMAMPDVHYCAVGQAQRMIMPLQGFVGDFRIDLVNEPPPVREFMTMELSRFQAGEGEVVGIDAAQLLVPNIRADILATYPGTFAQSAALAELEAFMQNSYPELMPKEADAVAA